MEVECIESNEFNVGYPVDAGLMDEELMQPLAKLKAPGLEYWMKKKTLVIGRNSSQGNVDVNMGNSSFISRRHIEVFYRKPHFYMVTGGKNGVFVDDLFQRKGAPPIQLPRRCTFRFPSTNIRIDFEACNPDGSQQSSKVLVEPLDSSHVGYNSRCSDPLKLDFPSDHDANFMSPYSSPLPAGGEPCSPRSFKTLRNGNSNQNLSDYQFCDDDVKLLGSDSNEAAEALYGRSVHDEINLSIVGDENGKPPYSYAQMICQAVASSADGQLTLSGIYSFIMKMYPYFRSADKGWQNSIRHNLSLNRYFIRVPRTQDEYGKGSFWRIEPSFEQKLIEQAWRKRRQRAITIRPQPQYITSDGVSLPIAIVPDELNSRMISQQPATHIPSILSQNKSYVNPTVKKKVSGNNLTVITVGPNGEQFKSIIKPNGVITQLDKSGQPKFATHQKTARLIWENGKIKLSTEPSVPATSYIQMKVPQQTLILQPTKQQNVIQTNQDVILIPVTSSTPKVLSKDVQQYIINSALNSKKDVVLTNTKASSKMSTIVVHPGGSNSFSSTPAFTSSNQKPIVIQSSALAGHTPTQTVATLAENNPIISVSSHETVQSTQPHEDSTEQIPTEEATNSSEQCDNSENRVVNIGAVEESMDISNEESSKNSGESND